MDLLVRATCVVVPLELVVSSIYLYCMFTIGAPPWVYHVQYYFAEMQGSIYRQNGVILKKTQSINFSNFWIRNHRFDSYSGHFFQDSSREKIPYHWNTKNDNEIKSAESERKRKEINFFIHRETTYTKLKCLTLWFSMLSSPVSSSNRGKNPGTKIGIMPDNLHFFLPRGRPGDSRRNTLAVSHTFVVYFLAYAVESALFFLTLHVVVYHISCGNIVGILETEQCSHCTNKVASIIWKLPLVPL